MTRSQFSVLAFVSIVAARSDADASCPIPGFSFAAFGDQSVSMGNGDTDSYDSTVAGYATQNCSTAGPCVGGVATNGTGSGAISLGPNGSVSGNCQIGATSAVTNIAPNSGNCQSTAVAAAPVSLPIATLPSSLTGTFGAVTNATTIATAGAYSMTSLTLSGNGKNLNIPSGTGSVVIYLTGTGSVLSLAGQGQINNNTQDPTKLVFMCTDTSAAAKTISVSGNGLGFFAIYCPQADITVNGGGSTGDIFGAVVGKSVTFNGNGTSIHYDKALANLTSGQIACSNSEISRATPVIASVNNQSCLVQGTLSYGTGSAKTITSAADLAAFEFPFNEGHLRARRASSVVVAQSGALGDSFASGTIELDAANGIPTVSTAGCSKTANGGFLSSCRNVFTNTNATPATGTTTYPTMVDLKDSTAATIGSLIAPTTIVGAMTTANYQTLIGRVLRGTANGTVAKLGGVDRSTPAVIEPSTLAGLGTRPKMIYFGAADGMLHAMCASTGGATASNTNVCDALGRELWAFIPRVQLPLIRVNKAIVDGSVRVVDAFGDFNNPATGIKSWRTILTFQTGYENSAVTGALHPATYAIDVTDPAKPVLLWEYVRPGTSSADGFDLGVGLAMHAGPTLKNGTVQNLAVAVTNNRGTGGNGVVASALSLETGTLVWKFGYQYPSPPRGNAGDNTMTATGVPGGAVGVDMTGGGFATHLVFGDLYGNLWKLDAATGVSSTGSPTTPLFSFTTNKRPIGAVPTIFDNGTKTAAFASGAYVDTEPTSTLWSGSSQKLIAVPLLPGTAPLTEASSSLVINADLGTNEKTAGQLLVVGNQIFLTTDTANINAAAYGTSSATTGHAYSFTIGSSTTLVAVGTNNGVIQGGASGLVNDGTSLYGGAADRQQRLGSVATSATGASVDYNNTLKPTRLVWLRAN
jgi:hypothetical protein